MKLVEIKEWSDERLITQNTPSVQGFNAMIVEELAERLTNGILRSNMHEIVDACDDVVVFSVGEIYKYGYDAEVVIGTGDIMNYITDYTKSFNLPYSDRILIQLGRFLEGDVETRIDAMKKMAIDSFHELIDMGYDPDKCMTETMKEISSRTGEYDEETKKWQKFKTPEAKAKWYTADYTNCRLES